LMVLSLLIATYLPYEVFIAAYAILGPLHYLTEISWLHDREYFARGRYYWLILLLPLIPLLPFATSLLPFIGKSHHFLMATSFVGAAGMACSRSQRGMVLSLVAGIGVGYLAQRWGLLATILLMLLPTVIHVYLFTGLFIVYGALKGRSLSGALSAIVFFSAPFISTLILSTPSTYQPSHYAFTASEPFHRLARYLARTFGSGVNNDTMISAMRFLGFAYTYHYLNWFSKTRIINWHTISRKRLVGILTLYVISLGAYAFSYEYGFAALLALSFGHVVLEFPLNFRSAAGIISEAQTVLGRGSPNRLA